MISRSKLCIRQGEDRGGTRVLVPYQTGQLQILEMNKALLGQELLAIWYSVVLGNSGGSLIYNSGRYEHPSLCFKPFSLRGFRPLSNWVDSDLRVFASIDTFKAWEEISIIDYLQRLVCVPFLSSSFPCQILTLQVRMVRLEICHRFFWC